MDDLVQWLRAQLDEDERIARKSIEQAATLLAGADADTISHWRIAERPATGVFVTVRDQWDRETEVVPTYGGAHSEHIARHDPARVLREIEAKRRMIETFTHRYEASKTTTYGGATGAHWVVLADTLLLLALPYADKPGYQDSWRP